MKKKLPFNVPVLCIATALLVGCGGSDDPSPQSCESDANVFNAALNAYLADPVKSKCQALLDAADEILDCPGITPAQRSEYQDSIAGVTCD